MRSRSPAFAVFLLFVVLYLVPLGLRPMSSPAEYRSAEVAREMLESGDWVVPRLDGLLYFEKPVLGHWARATSIWLFGPTAFAVRLPSALGLGLAALAAGLLVRRNPDSRASSLAAVIVLTSLLSVAVGTSALDDGLVAGQLTCCLVAAYFYLEARSSRDEWLPLLVAGGAAGFAFLSGGVPALILPVTVLVPYLVITRSLARFVGRSWIPAAAFFAVVLPWSLTAAARSDFWQFFFRVDQVQRFLEPGADLRAGLFWPLLPQLVAAIAPWFVLAPAAASGLRTLEDSSSRRRALFASCWLLFPLVFSVLSSGRTTASILLCVPPFAVLLSIGVLNYLRLGARRLLSLAVTVGAALPIVLIGGAAYGIMTGLPAFAMTARPGWRLGALAAAAAGWAVLAAAAFWRRRSGARLALLAAGPAVCFIGAQVALDDDLLHSPGRLVEHHIEHVSPATPLVGDGDTVAALCWLSQRVDVGILDDAGDLAYGLDSTPDRHLLDLDELVALADSSPVPVVALLEGHRWQRLQRRLPAPVSETAGGGFVVVELE